MLRRRCPPIASSEHSDVAPPARKTPARNLPWHSLATPGVGHRVQLAPIVRGDPSKSWAPSATTSATCSRRGRYGYAVRMTEHTTRQTMGSGHRLPSANFAPPVVDGVADRLTLTPCRRCWPACQPTPGRPWQGRRIEQLLPAKASGQPSLRGASDEVIAGSVLHVGYWNCFASCHRRVFVRPLARSDERHFRLAIQLRQPPREDAERIKLCRGCRRAIGRRAASWRPNWRSKSARTAGSR